MVAKTMDIRTTDIRATDISSADAQVIGEYLSRGPLHNIYLIDALARMLSAAAAPALERPVARMLPHPWRHPAAGCFWGAFGETSDLAGLLFIEPQDRRGSPTCRSDRTGCQQGAFRHCVGYLSYPDQTDGSHLACLGRFAAQSGVRTLIGHRAAVEPALVGLEDEWQVQTRLLHFYRADPKGLVRSYDYPVRRAMEDDIPELVKLYRGYEFSRRDTTDDEIRREIEQAMSQSGVYFCVDAPPDTSPGNEQDCADGRSVSAPTRRGGVIPPAGRPLSAWRIVSAARIHPETDDAGLIGAARTLPEYRGQGIYLAVRTACFEHLFAQGKAGVGMFLDTNTSMHQVIRKQGGTILAEWLIADLQPKPRRALVRLRRRLVPSQIRQWAIRCRNVSKTIFSRGNTHNDTFR